MPYPEFETGNITCCSFDNCEFKKNILSKLTSLASLGNLSHKGAPTKAANGIIREASLFGNFINWDNFILGATKVIPLVIVSYAVGLIVEFIFAVIDNKN